MSRTLDASLVTALANQNIQPAFFVDITFSNGVQYVWSGVGDFVYNGNTYKGVGTLGTISAIIEGTQVRADGVEVTLSGIGEVPFNPVMPPGLSAPNPSPPVGQQAYWAKPKLAGAGSSGGGNAAAADVNGASLAYASSAPLVITACAWAQWGDFDLSGLPEDAVIQSAWATFTALQVGPSLAEISFQAGTGLDMNSGLHPGGTAMSAVSGGEGQVAADITSYGLANIGGFQMGASLFQTVRASDVFEGLEISNIYLVVYYTSASNAISVINQAINTYQMGAPASIRFGLLQSGALIGSPYLVFSGLVDQPTIDMSTSTAVLKIALENKLTNLMRPTARRYTSADQNLQYPDDIGLNWVEILNDIALRWGS